MKEYLKKRSIASTRKLEDQAGGSQGGGGSGGGSAVSRSMVVNAKGSGPEIGSKGGSTQGSVGTTKLFERKSPSWRTIEEVGDYQPNSYRYGVRSQRYRKQEKLDKMTSQSKPGVKNKPPEEGEMLRKTDYNDSGNRNKMLDKIDPYGAKSRAEQRAKYEEELETARIKKITKENDTINKRNEWAEQDGIRREKLLREFAEKMKGPRSKDD